MEMEPRWDQQVRQCERLGDWNEVVSDAFSGCTVDAHDTLFDAALSRCRIGGLDLIHVRAQESLVQRWSGQAPRAGSSSVLLHLQAQGSCRSTQRRNDAVLNPGEGALCDPGHGYAIDFATPYEMYIVELPLAGLCARAPAFDLERFSGRKVDTSRSQLLLAFLQTAWAQRIALQGDGDWEECVGTTGLDLAVRAIRCTADVHHHGLPARLQPAVIGFIKQHLPDTGLRTSAIAQALGVSARSVQFVFERMATTASGFILELRLERAAALLSQPGPACSITAVAFECGFSDSAYFSRCFRARFGMAPRTFRSQRGQSH